MSRVVRNQSGFDRIQRHRIQIPGFRSVQFDWLVGDCGHTGNIVCEFVESLMGDKWVARADQTAKSGYKTCVTWKMIETEMYNG